MKNQKLIEACKKNDYKAQMEVYQLYKNMLFNTSLRIVKNEYDAQDIVHDAFIKAFQGVSKLGGDINLGGWLKRITINSSLDFLKKRNKTIWMEDSFVLEEESNEGDFETEELQIKEVKEAIKALKDKYRIIVVLYLIENYSHKEIAQELGLKESTVRNQYIRGKAQIVNQIKKTQLL